ncbi:saccharopine dehydrogenase NADP-binding domain-containing protein [Streptomyces pactum]|uniref:Saccharopine dehydrogenase NADP-binding domain-containing protein n=1 Tax=Streptomyces pactum TaxID=68249 RepID=A0ABS0NRF5_9ACTN|nr:saccharopine dehydrogenase NADP-binding domain-containing protein [Streptomyces pactum]MBH5337792.1 saccharopine dehydrogenase NADP-binding domain-containing protein [Streptomyces pactum]
MRRREDRGERAHDIVLFGATGFAGALTAEYLAAHAPAGVRWALAGRNRAKLERLRDRLAERHPGLDGPPLLHADATDPASLQAVAAGTHVVATTVGPYLRYGEPLVAACAEAGTDYVDLTGEPEFVDLMYLRHHERARRSGARLVHACGFDSVPHDLGVHYTVGLLPEGVPLRVAGFVRADAAFSGGTFASVLNAMARPVSMVRTGRERRRHEPAPAGRRVCATAGTLHRRRDLGAWAVPMPTLDPQIVGRSAAALDRYGPDFRYTHHVVVQRLPTVAGAAAGLGALFALSQLPPARRWLSARLGPGEGPDEARRARSWFAVRFSGEGGGRRVITEVSGGDPGYDETAKMLAESALCLAFDDLPGTAGQVTTATAMGEALTGRLVRAGLTFRTVATR